MAKSFSKSEKANIRQRLQKAGLTRFLRQGIRSARIDDLCRDVGIAKGSFYAFYASKEAMFMDIAFDSEETHRAQIRAFLQRNCQGAPCHAAAFFDMLVEKTRADPLLNLMIEHGEIEYLIRKIPPEQLQEKSHQDQQFLKELSETWRTRYPQTRLTRPTLEGLMSLLVVLIMQHRLLPPQQMDNSLFLLRETFIDRLTRTEPINPIRDHGDST